MANVTRQGVDLYCLFIYHYPDRSKAKKFLASTGIDPAFLGMEDSTWIHSAIKPQINNETNLKIINDHKHPSFNICNSINANTDQT